MVSSALTCFADSAFFGDSPAAGAVTALARTPALATAAAVTAAPRKNVLRDGMFFSGSTDWLLLAKSLFEFALM
jgi:hypothetical protein